MTAQTLEVLQQQLAEIQNNRLGFNASASGNPLVPANVVTSSEVRRIVMEMLEEERKKTESAGQPLALSTVSKIFEQHLEADELIWISKPEVAAQVLPYIASASGHELLRLFITDFKDFYESKTRSVS